MGIVGGNAAVSASHMIDDRTGDLLVLFDGYDTLSFKILAGCHGQTLGSDVAVQLETGAVQFTIRVDPWQSEPFGK